VNFHRITPLASDKIRDYRDFAKKYGMLYAASGFSTTIIKNEFFDFDGVYMKYELKAVVVACMDE
jgi:hypothetical protein